MLRRAGLEPRGIDYLFMKLTAPSVASSPESLEALAARGLPVSNEITDPARLEVDVIQECFRYSDWARDVVHGIAVTLDSDALSHSFDFGLKTISSTLLHIGDAEMWWFENWGEVPPTEFTQLAEDGVSMAELVERFAETSEKRNVLLEGLVDEDLLRVVEVQVAPGMRVSFRVGESMLQLFNHGSHHRAQVLAMLSELGLDVPLLDLAQWQLDQQAEDE